MKLEEFGMYIPPDPNTPACDEYEPAGIGAGLEADGYPQCAWCGWPREQHAPPARKVVQ